MAQNRFYSSATKRTTTTVDPGVSGTTLTVADSTVFASLDGSWPWTALINWGLADQEVVNVTARPTGTTLTVVRGQDGTVGQVHAVGATVDHGVSARDFTEAGAHVGSATGVHGLTGAVVGTSDAQTLSGKGFSDVPTVGGGLMTTFADQPFMVAGMKYATMPRWAITAHFAITTGVVYLVGVTLPINLSISNLYVAFETAEAGGTNTWAALLDNNRAMLARSAADTGATTIAGSTVHPYPVAQIAAGPSPTFVTAYGGAYYLAVSVSAATTMPSLRSIGAGGTTNTVRGNADAGMGLAVSGPSGTTQAAPPAFPFTVTAPTGSPQLFFYAGVG